jgi:predicted nucleotidyltransferase
MNEEILKRLGEIEREENVRIFYACESGSRAWGFESTDSDWDVRFIYVHPRDWYLSIDVEDKRDVIERPINDELDISGWDLRKALKLLRKSNPPLLEWLSSPIIYKETAGSAGTLACNVASFSDVTRSTIEQPSIAQQLRDAVAEFYSPVSAFHHYLHMAQGNNREYLKGDIVWIKKYFYVLRPLLAIRWIEIDPTRPVPMKFQKLVDACVDSAEVRSAIDDLLTCKRASQELDRQPKIEALSRYIETELSRLEKIKVHARQKPNFERLNEIFRSVVG